MDTAFAKVVRTANGPAILIDGYVIGVSPPPELGHEICVDAIVNGLRGQATVVGGPEPIYARLTPEMLPSLDTLGGFTLHAEDRDATLAEVARANDALKEQIEAVERVIGADSNVVSFDDHKARKFIEGALIQYHNDPADTDYQEGFRDALALAYAEGLGLSSTDDRIAAVLDLTGAHQAKETDHAE